MWLGAGPQLRVYQVCFLFVEMRAIIALLVGMKGPEKVSVVNLFSKIDVDATPTVWQQPFK